MTDLLARAVLAFQEQAPAPAPGGGPPRSDAGPGILWQLMPFVVIFALFWFIMIRPQRKQEKERRAMLDALKENDHVLTSGGVYGVVARIKDHEVYLKVDEKSDVRLRVARSAIVSVEKASGGGSRADRAEAASEPSKH